MLRAIRMKRFWLAVPVEYEEQTIKKIGELGVAHFTRGNGAGRTERKEWAEVSARFTRVRNRINSVSPRSDFQQKVGNYSEQNEIDLEKINSFIGEFEEKLNLSIKALEKEETEIKHLSMLQEYLGYFASSGLKLDEIGTFQHIFVKAGFINNSLLSRLSAYSGGTSVVIVAKPGRIRESFIVLSGLIDDLPFFETNLKLLNFEEFTFPSNINNEPKLALEEIKSNLGIKEHSIQNIRNQLSELRGKFETFESHALNTLEVETARDSLLRTKTRTLIEGWIPESKMATFKTGIEQIVPKEKIYLKFEDPRPGDKVPAQFDNKGILSSFQTFVNLQGVPNYFEINPTPIYTALYIAMFGIMFGDMGGGATFVLIGFLLTRSSKGVFNFSSGTTRRLGKIIISCGISAMIFGFIYNELFLVKVLPFTILEPLQSINQIITIALLFGIAQITLALTINIINRLRKGELPQAIFSGRGIVGLVYYSAGIVLAITYIRSMNFAVFLQKSTVIFTFVALLTLSLIFFSPLIESRIEHKKGNFFEKIIMGFGEALETFISYITNSVSYIRLAAFAIAHVALAMAAVIFASSIGYIPSLILLNVIAFLIEGFAAFIQSLRLMYYEFSTKFFVGNGTSYKPFKT